MCLFNHWVKRSLYILDTSPAPDLNAADLLACDGPLFLLTASLRNISSFWSTPPDHHFSLWTTLWVFYIRNLHLKSPKLFPILSSGNSVGLDFYIKAYDPFGLECMVDLWIKCILYRDTKLFYYHLWKTCPSLPRCLLYSHTVPPICLSSAARHCHSGAAGQWAPQSLQPAPLPVTPLS